MSHTHRHTDTDSPTHRHTGSRIPIHTRLSNKSPSMYPQIRSDTDTKTHEHANTHPLTDKNEEEPDDVVFVPQKAGIELVREGGIVCAPRRVTRHGGHYGRTWWRWCRQVRVHRCHGRRHPVCCHVAVSPPPPGPPPLPGSL